MTRSAMKQCSKCGEEKPATSKFFHRKSASSDGLCSQCCVCVVARVARWRETNVERKRASDREYHKRYAERCWTKFNQWYIRPENKRKVRAAATSWVKDNIEKERERAARRSRTPEERIRLREWKKANKEKVRCHVRNRRARKADLAGTVTQAVVTAIYERQAGSCFYCGVPLGTSFHVDHKIPVFRQGASNLVENLCCACPPCNLQKQDKTADEYVRFRRNRGLPVREEGV